MIFRLAPPPPFSPRMNGCSRTSLPISCTGCGHSCRSLRALTTASPRSTPSRRMRRTWPFWTFRCRCSTASRWRGRSQVAATWRSSRRATKDLVQYAPAAPRYLQWINASRGAVVRLITVEEVLYFKSYQNYTLVVTSDAEALIKKTIKELSEELDPTMFLQVHRSTMVNVHAIDNVIRDDYGNLKLRLKHRSEVLSVSEAYHHLFHQM